MAFYFPLKAALGGLLLFSVSCKTTTPSTFPAATKQSVATHNATAEETVRQFITAYNNKNLDGMLALAHNEIAWLSVEGDKTSVMTDGADALREEMKSYLGPDANPKSAIEILKSHGNFVTALERAYWMENGEEKSQASFAMYEVIKGKVRRVWYFPASE